MSTARARLNLGLNVALAVGVVAALAGGRVLLFADARSPKGVVVVTPERPLTAKALAGVSTASAILWIPAFAGMTGVESGNDGGRERE